MSYIYSVILIRQPVQQIFDYVTTPGNWPQWHPSSLRVKGATDHPLGVGEQVTEDCLVAGRRGQVVWTVRDCLPRQRWIIEGQIIGSLHRGTIVYRFSPSADGTLFEREFTYTLAGPCMRLLGWLGLHRRVQAESDQALRCLKNVLEQKIVISQPQAVFLNIF
jgi:hypothetical protein